MNDSAFQPGPFGLYEMTRPAGSDPVPEGFQEAERIFEAARKDYEAGRWMEAARRFLQAAKVLPRQPPFHRDTVAAGRVACYRNATSAFLMANAGEEARQVLEALVVEDPACADPIHEEIRRLER
ncbi:hypothetical protein KBD49_08445 [Myxococcota bacterium]|nr:hypothetical protein [Myxococcota bacterium]